MKITDLSVHFCHVQDNIVKFSSSYALTTVDRSHYSRLCDISHVIIYALKQE